ncbi:hypothetical protein GCM10017712_35080 [Curtobacterium citreum]
MSNRVTIHTPSTTTASTALDTNGTTRRSNGHHRGHSPENRACNTIPTATNATTTTAGTAYGT